LPKVRFQLGELAPFHIEYGGAEHESVVFVIDGNGVTPFFALIIIISCEFLQVRFESGRLNPPVEIKHFGAPFADSAATVTATTSDGFWKHTEAITGSKMLQPVYIWMSAALQQTVPI
jgi:hypothetical protein